MQNVVQHYVERMKLIEIEFSRFLSTVLMFFLASLSVVIFLAEEIDCCYDQVVVSCCPVIYSMQFLQSYSEIVLIALAITLHQ